MISLAYLPIALFLLSRALDRSSWRYGALAGVAAALIVTGRDQVALLEIYVLAGFVFATGAARDSRARAREHHATDCGRHRGRSSSRCR